MHLWKHFKTITYHKWLVGKGCFAIGLYKQGILHDLSKYSPEEFITGAKYYQGTRSPNDAERESEGFSKAWLHHKGRNKHHYDYWMDYVGHSGLQPVPMPNRYIAEMVMDRMAACKVYLGKNYTDEGPWNYYKSGNGTETIHPETREKLELLLKMLAQQGERETYRYIKKVFLQSPKEH